MVTRLGQQVTEREEELNRRIREQEVMPQGVCVLAASLDGANVLMREPGAKRGRKAERPMDRTQSKNTAYRNAMAGAVSVYGAVPEGEKRPQRLQTRYVSYMPEEQAVTFKGKFEQELSAVEAVCKSLIKTRLCRSGMRWSKEGGQAVLTLRTYVKSNRWDSFWKHVNELERAA